MTFILDTNPFIGSSVSNDAMKWRAGSGRAKRNAVFEDELWPGAIVPYYISAVFSGTNKSLNCLLRLIATL